MKLLSWEKISTFSTFFLMYEIKYFSPQIILKMVEQTLFIKHS